MNKILPAIIALCLFFSTANSQLWKQYADSAKTYRNNNADSAIFFYNNALHTLIIDSANSYSYAEICFSIGDLYMDLPGYDSAAKYFKISKNIAEKILGKKTSLYVGNCNSLGNLYKEIGKYKLAESYYLESKSIRETMLGKTDSVYAAICDNLGDLYRITGEYKKARLYASEGNKIYEYLLNTNNESDYAISCNNIANIYSETGEFSKANFFYEKAKEIWGRTFGKQSNYYAIGCLNLAILYKQTGEYEKAEALYLEAKQIFITSPGKESRAYAYVCNNLGNFYSDLGQYEKAEHFYIEAKDILKKLFGQSDIDYAAICDDLANLYSAQDKYLSAEALYIEAKNIRAEVLGKENPDYAASCLNLADLLYYTGKYEKAKLLYLEAKQIQQKTLGQNHPDYAAVCDHLGSFYENMHYYKSAELLFLQSKQIREQSLGKNHPLYAESCTSLANLYWNEKKREFANSYFKKAFISQITQLKKIFQFTNEAEKHDYLKKLSDFNSNLYSFNTSSNLYTVQGLTYNVSLSNRNLILSSSQQLRQSIYNSTDTSIQNKYNNWMDTRQQLSFWYAKPISERPDYVKDLEEQVNILEKELTRTSSAFKTQQLQTNITWQTIQQNLKPNEAAIEFVDFDFYNGKRFTDSIYYIALLLRKDKPEPQLINLFEKEQLDSILNNNDINSLYTQNIFLYRLIWKPLEKYLSGISKVYFAPTGNLFKISFAALPVNDKEVLSDKYQLVQLNTTAFVTDKKEDFVNASDKIQLYGGIQYTVDTTALKQVTVAYHLGNDIAMRFLPNDLERGGSIQYLPGTEKEVDEIKDEANKTNTPVTTLSGISATEESFKALNGKNSPSLLHIATHGFFFPDPKQTDSIQRRFETSAKVFRQSDNPLFRSGLLFAGANNAWQGKPISGIEDGIVTAYDVSNMYLPNTKLVVLSACETALGDIEGSEGVYGLQRSFKIAGVQNLVMSLWKVPDEETAEFMRLFYDNLFAHQSISNAFYHAQTDMKNKYRNEPAKWAAWVLVR
jgi:CHAT domain-containing protein